MPPPPCQGNAARLRRDVLLSLTSASAPRRLGREADAPIRPDLDQRAAERELAAPACRQPGSDRPEDMSLEAVEPDRARASARDGDDCGSDDAEQDRLGLAQKGRAVKRHSALAGCKTRLGEDG